MATLNAKDLLEEEAEAGALDTELDGGVPAGVVEAPGIIRDAFSGKTWTLPTGAMADLGLATYKSPRDIKKDPNFHYEFCRVGGNYPELDEKLSQDFVPVTREELGMAPYVNPTGQPSPLDSYYIIDGQDICVKIPRQLADLRYAANKSVCDAALDGVRRKGTYTTRDKDGNLIADSPAIGAGGEPVQRELKVKTNRHAPSRDELA
jgi:hypothetical protein